MRLFSCDVCGKTLNPQTDPRFVWKVEGTPVPTDEEPTVLEDDDLEIDDSVDTVDELLIEREQREDDGDTVEMLPVCVRRAYDVCGGCYMKLVNDPLGLDAKKARPFSRN